MIVLFLFFGGGFYVGVRAARHAVLQGPDWARRLFTLPPGSTPQTQVSTVVTPAPPPKSAPAVQQPPATNISPPATSPAPSSNGASAPESPASPPAELSVLVPQYNDILHRIQDVQHRYALVQQQAATKTRPQELQPLLNEQESILKDMTAAAQRAKTLQAQIKADPQFVGSYQEAAPCLAPAEVPTRLLNLGMENLRFIEPHSGGDNSSSDNSNGT